ncbi:MAG: hypothetical protein JWR02_2512 [Mucilaginibacter sp.]|nr:hypothetical protein [Mucilaginibacter sp.]
MLMKLPVLLLLVLVLFYCFNKGRVKPVGSPTACTDIFASIGVHFVDKQGQSISVQNFQAIDLRTRSSIGPMLAGYGTLVKGYYIIADDGDLSKLLTAGDDIQVSGTDPATNQTKTVTIKIAGGCTCHVSKISGADQITFD